MQLYFVLRIFRVLVVGHAAAKLIALASTSVMGRALGPGDLGILGSALTALSYVLVLSNWGQDATGIRLVAIDPSIAKPLRGRVFRIRLTGSVIGGAFASGLTILGGWPAGLVLPLWGGAIAYAARLDWLLLGLGRARDVALASTLREVVFLLLVVIIAARTHSLTAAAISFLVAEIAWSLATQAAWQWSRQPPNQSNIKTRELLAQGWPIAVMALMSLTYNKIDTPLLAYFRSPGEAGRYWASYSVIFAVMGLAGLFSTSALPEMSRAHRSSLGASTATVGTLAIWAALAGACAAVILVASAGTVVRALFGAAFTDGAVALRILALALPIHFASTILLNGLVAAERRRPLATGAILAAIGNLGLNLLLIPKWGMAGAALATVASETALLATGIVGSTRQIGTAGLSVALAWVAGASALTAILLPRMVNCGEPLLSLLSIFTLTLLVGPLLFLRKDLFRIWSHDAA